MKKLVFTLAIVFGLIISGSAQQQNPQRTPEERAAIQTEWMKTNMNLTEEQLSNIETLNLEYATKMEEVRQIDGKIAKLKKARSISDEKDAKFKTVLNEEQYQQYLDMKKELRSKANKMYKEQNK